MTAGFSAGRVHDPVKLARDGASQAAHQGRINPNVSLGSQSARNLSTILERIFGVEILEGQLEETCTGSFTYENRLDIPCDRPGMIGRTILGWVLDIFVSTAEAQTTDSNVNVQLPRDWPGLRGYGSNFPQGWDGTCPIGSTNICDYRTGQYGTAGTIEDLKTLGTEWNKKYPNGPPIYVGDISVRNGRAWPLDANNRPWHADHRDGKRVDVRPIHNDGTDEPLTWESNTYDREKTKELIKMILEDSSVTRVIFNDPMIFSDSEFEGESRLHRDSPGNRPVHDNHIHIDYDRN